MKRKKRIILGVSLGVFILCALLTGGLAVSNANDFGGQRDISLVDGLKSDVALSPQYSRFDLPFVLHYFSRGGPFSLQLQIWDRSKQYQSIDITGVMLEYRDGEVVRTGEGWSRPLKPYTQHNSSSKGIILTEMLQLSDQMDGLVLRHTDVKVTLKGQLGRANGESVAFEVAELFEAESKFHIATYWQALLSE